MYKGPDWTNLTIPAKLNFTKKYSKAAREIHCC